MMRRLCLMYTMDPRGTKVGGIETHIRLILKHHPADFSVLLVGIDERGDCRPGQVVPIEVAGRRVDFLPVARIAGGAANALPASIAQSVTFRYVAGALRHLGAIRRAVGRGPASADLHRIEFAPVARLLGVPVSQMVHGEPLASNAMDSLIRNHRRLHRLGERFALRSADWIFCVTPDTLDRLRRERPAALKHAELMTVSVDGTVFAPAPFDCADGVLRIVFAGRLDTFKDPALMFRTIARLRERLGGAVEFHYVGSGDPARFPEFAAISGVTRLHGSQTAEGVAEVMRRCHAGILTSHFEGLPCFLLETLASGRPIGAIRLPQYDTFLQAGVSGRMVERGVDAASSVEALAAAFMMLWDDIRSGSMQPREVARKIAPQLVENQMHRLFERHRRLQNRDGQTLLPEAPAVRAPV